MILILRKSLLTVAIAVLLAGAAHPNTAVALERGATIKIERDCPITFTAAATRPLTVDVWRHVRWQRGQPKPATIRVYSIVILGAFLDVEADRLEGLVERAIQP